jgi:hypothetical protein
VLPELEHSVWEPVSACAKNKSFNTPNSFNVQVQAAHQMQH